MTTTESHMGWQFTTLTALCGVSGVLGLALTAALWRERPKAGATWLALAAGAFALWALGQAAVTAATTVEAGLAAYTASFVPMIYTAPTMLLFAVRYTGTDRFQSRWTIGALLAEPLVLVALALTNPSHHLVFADAHLVERGGRTAFAVAIGPAQLAQHLYDYVLLLVAEYLLALKFLGSRNVYRKRTFFFMFLLAVLMGSHVVSTGGLSPLPYNTLAPVAYSFIAALSLVIVLGYRGLEFLPLDRLLAPFSKHSKNLSPIARDRAIEEMEIGFLVTDHKQRVVDVNPMGKRIVGREGERVVGKRLEELIPPELYVDGVPEFIGRSDASGKHTGIWVETPDGEQRCFDVLVSDIDPEADSIGSVALVHDVTDRQRRKRQLEEQNAELTRQNEQLESFASIVSHDLRNPLNVAEGRIELIEAETDTDHVEPAKDALGRMREIIDDVLTLARTGQTVSETERVDLGELAERAWENVDTREATLTVELDREADVDPTRMLEVFENLFRNAVEHGREDVAITVGPIEGAPDTADGILPPGESATGIYVADDGPGIPEDKREDVLQQGVTTSDTGTGFGLSICKTIVEAHGGSIAISESDGSGARFEITGDAFAEERDRRAIV
ncbi:MAG: histidine kinase N-terminal 7TM domain-containing protein [Haloarculaceae archaeon]